MARDELDFAIRRFLEQELLVTFDDSTTPDTDLFRAGVIESSAYLSIIKFLETRLGIEITDDDLFTNVLVSLSAIVAFARKKRRGSS